APEERPEILIGPRPGAGEDGRALTEGRGDRRFSGVEEEEVHPEGALRRCPDGMDIFRDLLRRGAADTERAQATSVADGRHEGYGGPPGHAAQRDRVPNPEHVADGRVDHG